MIRQARQIASVCIASRNSGPSSKPCSRIICSLYMPQPSTNSGASVRRRTSDGWRRGRRELEVVARVGLVDAGVADRGVVVLAHRVRVVADRRRDDVDARSGAVELGRLEVGGEGDDGAQVLGRGDDAIRSSGRHRREVVVDRCGREPGTSRPGRPRAPRRTSAGWFDLTRSTTSASSTVGSISRAASTRAALFSASCS